jgi:hypothetical protein
MVFIYNLFSSIDSESSWCRPAWTVISKAEPTKTVCVLYFGITEDTVSSRSQLIYCDNWVDEEGRKLAITVKIHPEGSKTLHASAVG